MRLGLPQCKAAHESAALRGLRRSLRSCCSSSSSSSSSARSIQHHLEAPHSLPCPSIYSSFSSSSSSAVLSVKSNKRHRVQHAAKSELFISIEARKVSPIRRQRSLDLTSIRAPNLSRTLCRTSSCTTIGRKRVLGFDDHDYSTAPCFPADLDEEDEEDEGDEASPRKRFASLKLQSSCLDRSSSIASPVDLLWWSASPQSPSTPPASFDNIHGTRSLGGDSLLEDLPFDLLIRIICCLEHDDLKPVSQVCKNLFQAVSAAWQSHFCFMTPRREKRGLKFELFPDNPRVEATSHGSNRMGAFVRPPTPQAPRQPVRPSEARMSDLSEVFPFVPSSSSANSLDSDRMKPLSMSFHRVLFSEDELCQAVAENTLT